MGSIAPERSLPLPPREFAGPSGQRGASLIEIMVATLILSFVAIGTAEFFVRGRTGFDQEEHKRVGVLLAQEALERTVAQPYPQIVSWVEQRTIASVDYAIAVTAETDVPDRQPDPRGESQFKCDGREYCSQMSSRAEAEYFLKNCPNTKMDGDNDGIPCENDSRF